MSHPSWRTPIDNIRLRISAAGNPQLPALRDAAFATLTTLQQYPADIQLQAIFMVATAMSETLALDPHEFIARARNQLADADAAFTWQMPAIRDYAGNEMRSQLGR